MSNPSISAICVTYGRVAWLESAIADFLAQDYKGPKELLVYNTFPGQDLHLQFAWDVCACNSKVRPASLGEARNAAVDLAQGDVIVTWDDDDAYLPHHLRTFAEAFEDNGWVWMEKQFWGLGEEINSIVPG